jgi:hypothetical protein
MAWTYYKTNETKTVKKIFYEKQGGRRGRRRLKWIDDEEDLRNMDIKRWRIKALDRVKWTSIIKEAKAKLKGPQCYRKKKVDILVESETRIYRQKTWKKKKKKINGHDIY